MAIIGSLFIGYILGTISPSAVICAVKGVDIRKSGTGNLGATNTLINFGRGAGLFVMIFDIGKAYLAFRLGQLFFPGFDLSGLLSGSAAVVGHIFPFYLGFRGGKGFASLGGLILAFDCDFFLTLLGFGLAVMIITDIPLSLQLTAALLFPVRVYLHTGSAPALAVSLAVCALVLAKHRENFSAALRGEGVRVRAFVREYFPDLRR